MTGTSPSHKSLIPKEVFTNYKAEVEEVISKYNQQRKED